MERHAALGKVEEPAERLMNDVDLPGRESNNLGKRAALDDPQFWHRLKRAGPRELMDMTSREIVGRPLGNSLNRRRSS
jgi:hypothetical protein